MLRTVVESGLANVRFMKRIMRKKKSSSGRYGKYNVSAKEERTSEGFVFASKMEMERYNELRLLEVAGKISGLIRQPCFEIIAAGKRNKAHNYTPDFQYTENGQLIVEEVKGVFTKDYILRRELFLQRYPYEFREIHNKVMKKYPAVAVKERGK